MKCCIKLLPVQVFMETNLMNIHTLFGGVKGTRTHIIQIITLVLA